jgi:5-methylcytosine rRNA methyltransferase NSUN4
MQIPENFQNFFTAIYQSRWPQLLEALCGNELQVQRPNLFSLGSQTPETGAIPRGENGLLQYYVMDPASIEVAKALDVQNGDKVLDMCAAPGGKSLILAEGISEAGELICNEYSSARRERLTKVIQQYIPRDVRDRVWVTGKEGGKFALTHKDSFDRILVDAPCSGERHLLRTPKELSQWSESRSKKLAQRQYALMTAALIACKSGGRIVYATCSISPLENDQVIQRLMKKKEGEFKVVQLSSSLGEPTECGRQFLPDKDAQGPIYFSVLEKN